MIEVIESSKKTLDIAIYAFSRQSITAAIAQAKIRGVKVRLITDASTCTNNYQTSHLAKLTDLKIPVRVECHEGLMHLKLAIADKALIATGTYNYSNAATDKNTELLLVIDSKKLASEMMVDYEDLWNSINGETTWKGFDEADSFTGDEEYEKFKRYLAENEKFDRECEEYFEE